MKVKYQAEDGYAGGSRPLSCNIDPEDIADCETVEEMEDVISQIVQDDFEQKVTWCYMNHEGLIEQLQQIIEDRKK